MQAPPAVELDEVAGKCQAEPGPRTATAGGAFDLVKTVEEMDDGLLWNTDALINDLDLYCGLHRTINLKCTLFSNYTDFLAGINKFDGIG